jgi:hypothetical protein
LGGRLSLGRLLQAGSLHYFLEGGDFGEVFNAGFGFGAGGDVEGGGADGGESVGGVVGGDAAGEDEGEVGVAVDELSGESPVDGFSSAAVDAGGVGVEEEAGSAVVFGVLEGGGAVDADGFDEGDVEGGEGNAVFGSFVAVELDEVDEAILEELGGEFGAGVDEDADAEDAVLEGGKEVGGRLGRAVAFGLRPEVDAEGRDVKGSELLGIVGDGDAADLLGGGCGVEEVWEERGHGNIGNGVGGGWLLDRGRWRLRRG